MTERRAALCRKTKLYTLAALSIAMACALALAPAATASTAAVQASVLYFAGSPTESNHLTVSFDWARGAYVLEDTGSSRLTPGAGCEARSAEAVTCPVGSFARIDARLGNGPLGFAQSNLAVTSVYFHAGNGQDKLIGGGGRDTLEGGSGSDTLTAGTGDTTLIAGIGPTILQGGSGRNTYRGGAGTDVINARNGVAEQITCVGVSNSVVADPSDTVSGSCATLDRGFTQPIFTSAPSAAGPTRGIPVPGPIRPGSISQARAVPLAQLVLGQVAHVRSGAVPVRLSCPGNSIAACSGTIKLALAARPAAKRAAAARRRKIVISRPRRFRIAPGKTATVLVPLWRPSASLFRRDRRTARLAVTISTHTERGATTQVQMITVTPVR